MIVIYEDGMIAIYEDDKKTCESNLTDGEVCESTAGTEDNWPRNHACLEIILVSCDCDDETLMTMSSRRTLLSCFPKGIFKLDYGFVNIHLLPNGSD